MRARFLDPEQRRLLETCASLIALSIERDESVLEAQQAQLQVEAEQLRNSLLSSVSHDLRTPLATIAGTAVELARTSAADDDRELLQTIVDESRRLARLVENLLDMARLDSGARRAQSAMARAGGNRRPGAGGGEARARRTTTCASTIPPDFPLLSVDAFLLEQVLVNLLENASRYTPAGSAIEISAAIVGKTRRDSRRRQRPRPAARQRRRRCSTSSSAARPSRRTAAAASAWGWRFAGRSSKRTAGEITAANRREGGAEFRIVLPCNEPPPQIRGRRIVRLRRACNS